jgi:hypothetical protein
MMMHAYSVSAWILFAFFLASQHGCSIDVKEPSMAS